ncbi:MAG: tripartite tricarboxylate transporter substrate binding protein [Burkholderiales bacterium]|nr:tripartite tricarboxylate transporter substrate binding protein [Burkholderiales bacterium]
MKQPRFVAGRAVAGTTAAVTLAAATCWCTPPALAQDYPARGIRVITPVSSGSGGDIVVRYYADKLAKLTGKPVIVDNKGGAQGIVGTEYASRAKPDGYTVLITPASSMLAAQPHFFRNLSFDPFRDFTPVVTLAWLPFCIAVDARSTVRSIEELVAHLRNRPNNGFYGMTNNTGMATSELLKHMTGLKTVQVPYKSSPQSLTGLITGQVDFMVADSTFASGHVRAGRIRVVAVTSAMRSSSLPDVPTMMESGFPDFELSAWWGVVVPAGTGKPIIDRLAGWFGQITELEETRKFLFNVATDVMPGTPESMEAKLKQEYERWGKLVALTKIQPQ